ncbi:lipase family protein [Candidatus Nitrotoga sp. 1052]|uniref:lipase family protein n=1 Tax=Candidatus Nitrotoga sp. 1052 TaxID=2886964 RepID=UPI001EF594D5|nr:hypothetical protein [Candidatus Nitrotoga sp. 1052]CAH1074593.1 Lipase (Class 3) [Candidatus Nitrotoga sp. 1052]
MSFDQRFRDALNVASKVTDWDDPYFTWEKAYIASVFSLAAYQHIPEFEIENAERAKLIPCEEYQATFASQSFTAAQSSLQTQDAANIFVVVREKVVVVLSKIKTALFISLRGTQSLYDLAADLDLRRVRFPPEKDSLIQLHRGFFEAVASCLQEVIARAAERLDDDTPLYITGHSLGGAMAAIMNAQMLAGVAWRSRAFVRRPYWRLLPTACFAFGMPRYGNRYAVSQLAYPFHVYNERDVVPTIPPRLLGFADSPDEYCLTAAGRLLRPHEKGGGLFRLRGGRLQALGAKEHKMERYVERAESAHKNGVS